jgi:hypothetical protein
MQARHFILDTKSTYTQLGIIPVTEYFNHILNTGHVYGSMTDTMQIIKIKINGKHLNTLEKYHTYIYI